MIRAVPRPAPGRRRSSPVRSPRRAVGTGRALRTGPGAAAALVVLAIAACGLLPGPATAAAAPPKLDADSWAVIDFRTGETLAGHAAKRRLPMASTTKMMTAYLVMRDLPFKMKVRAVDYHPVYGESLMGLEAGQKVSVRDLMYGLILLSGNDAAVTLAVADSGSVPAFVRKMNRTARRLGLSDTHYENPVGLDGKRQYSSARDLTRLGRILMGLPGFRPIAASRSATLRSYSPPVEIESTNHFVLDNGWAKGIKTGHTLGAGYLLVSDGRRRATELIGAVMGTPTEAAREDESVRLLDYGFSLYTKRVPIRPGRRVTAVPIRYTGDDLGLVARRPVRIGVRRGEELTTRILVPEEVTGPVRRGAPIGRAMVTVDGERIATVRLVAARPVAEATLLEKVRSRLPVILISLAILLSVIIGLYMLLRRRQSRRMEQRLKRLPRRQR